MTMRELAKLANVSISTVSKAFNDSDDISPETKKRVFDVAKQYGVYGKYYKGKYPKKIVAIIVPELCSAYYASHVARLQTIIEQHSGIAVISTYDFDDKKQAELVEYYASYLQVDGILVFSLMSPLKKACRQIPIVSLHGSTDADVDTVQTDLYTPFREAMTNLFEKGHRHFAFVGETLTHSKSVYFASIADSLGAAYDIITCSSRFEEAGEEAVEAILQLPHFPDAILCGYDNIALGLIKKLQERGYATPQDYAIIGMDNIDASKYSATTLSTIDSGIDEICMIAYELLEKKMQNIYYRCKREITVVGKLILRESTG